MTFKYDQSRSALNKGSINQDILNSLSKNVVLFNYLKEGGFLDLLTIKENHIMNDSLTDMNNQTEINNIKNTISGINKKLKEFQSIIINDNSDKFRFMNLFKLSTKESNVKNFKVLKNDSNTDLLTSMKYINNNNQEYLVLIKIDNYTNSTHQIVLNEKTRKYSICIIKLNIESLIIMDFDFQKDSLLTFLVKNEKNGKISIVQTKLDNYVFTNIPCHSNVNSNGYIPTLDLDYEIMSYFKNRDDKIVINGYLEIDCSSTVYMACGNRGILSIIDSQTNKLVLVDLHN